MYLIAVLAAIGFLIAGTGGAAIAILLPIILVLAAYVLLLFIVGVVRSDENG